MPLHSVSVVSVEMIVVMIGAASLATAGAPAGLSPEDAQVMWCLVGGCLGAFCSLHFFRVPPSNHASADIAWQFAVNLILSGVFSPLLVPFVAARLSMPEYSMRVAIPTATVLGLVAQRAVARVLPIAQRVLDARANKVASELGAQQEVNDVQKKP